MKKRKLSSQMLRKFRGKIVRPVEAEPEPEVQGPKRRAGCVEVDRAVVERALKVRGPAVFGMKTGSEVRRRRRNGPTKT